MAEELVGNLGYDALQVIDVQAQSDSKRQELLECILTGNSKVYLGKVYTEDQLKRINDEKVENSLIIAKLSYQARW